MLRFKHPWLAQESAARAFAMDRTAHVFARLRYAMPDAHPERHHVSVLRDIAYSGAASCRGGPAKGRHHLLDVYVPRRVPKPLPVIMYVHGGGFSMLSKDTHYVMAMAFARRGYLVFNINYRLGPKHIFPEPLEDAAAALLWVHRHAAEYGGDRERLAIAGESAGGNLVTALAVASAARMPQAFASRLYDANISLRAAIATYPLLDICDAERMLASERLPFLAKRLLYDAATAYLGSNFLEVARREPLASPLLVLERGLAPLGRPLAPFFISVGTRDILLPQAKRMSAVLDRLGVQHGLFVAPGEVHGFDAMVWRAAAREKWSRVHAFLAEQMS